MSLADNNNPRLKKAKLLCTIKSQITKHGISENILDSLELIQKLEASENNEIPNSMKLAYCAVAVDCTVKHLSEYVDAVKRIWWGRLREREKSEFVCDELRVWRERIEGVVLGENVCDEILSVGNSRDYALGMVRAYLGEAWAEVGPDLLFGCGEGLSGKCRDKDDGGLGGDSWGLVVSEGGLGKRNRPSGVNEARDEVGSSGGDKDQSPPDVAQDTGSRDGPLMRERGIIRKPNVASKCKHVPSHRRAKGRIRIAKVQESDTDILQSEYDTIPTPEVAKLQGELKSSCLELQAVVKDPLPDALREADGLVSNWAKKNRKTECLVATPNRCDANATKSSGCGGVETAHTGETNIQTEAKRTAQTNEANIQVEMEGPKAISPTPSGSEGIDPVSVDGNATGDQSHSHQNDVPKRSLMERNGTAQTFEWDDSIDNSPDGLSKRMKLPTPKRLAISPLKNFGDIRISRRQRKRWSNLEEDTLRMGVQKFGKGNWKVILTAYGDIFEDRTEVDLKDKWRNLTR